MYRDRFSTELAERMGLPQQVLGDLVQEALIVQRANAEGLSVSDEELNARINAIPLVPGKRPLRDQAIPGGPQAARVHRPAFEAEIRRELTRAKVEAAIRSGVKVSETELEEAFRLRREEVRASWALVELRAAARRRQRHRRGAHGLSHAASRRVPAARPPSRAVRDLEPEGLRGHGDRRRRREVLHRARQRVRDAAPSARGPRARSRAGDRRQRGEDKARAKVADVIRRAKAGADFGKLAQEVSEDTATARAAAIWGWWAKVRSCRSSRRRSSR